ncbi:MAG: bifunctional 2-polyprenyl-6-hydroxyphenol methylase/3-demethylubiquinol 3-O-methyltransferase UbiG [Zetaproteobacteria bacterium]|nr:MAG: bifunctional 2-polyprenyl-6-hydroxyphenol methylase/3-demethylubiquinol 3-O-methyltransferase UbiG [Zetaproteobacteria bacterium]
MQPPAAVDRSEIDKFDALAAEWWDPEGRFRPLHRIQPIRLGYIRRTAAPLAGRRLLDVGCGGGLLAEALAAEGAEVTGIDRSERAIAIARSHAAQQGIAVDYAVSDAETWAETHQHAYDLITCLEVLEHLPDVPGTLAACSAMLQPGGLLFFATINRTPTAWLKAILGAEYLLGWLPRGTHDYRRFIRPSELQRALRGAGLTLRELRGLCFDPLANRFYEGEDLSVNYMGFAVQRA